MTAMLFQQSSRAARLQWQLHGRRLGQRVAASFPFLHAHHGPARAFHGSRSLMAVKPVLLADIGEGKSFNVNEYAPAQTHR